MARISTRTKCLALVAACSAALGPLAAVSVGDDHSVSLSASQLSPVVGEQVTFTAHGASTDANTADDSYDFHTDMDELPEQTGGSSTFTASFPQAGGQSVWVIYNDGSGGPEAMDTLDFTVYPALTGSIAGPAQPDPGEPTSFSASAAGGKGPHSFAWDVDGDGFDDGTGPSIAPTFDTPGARTVRVRIGDSAAPAHQLVLQRAVTVSQCLKRLAFGVVEITTKGCLRSAGGAYETTAAVKLNGIPFPAPGGSRKLVVRPPSSRFPGGRLTVAKTTIKLGGLTVFKGNVDWRLPAGGQGDERQVATLAMPGGQKLFGLKVAGSVALRLGFDARGRRYATFPLNVQLPDAFKSGPDKRSGGVSGTGAVRVDERGVHYDGLRLIVDDAWVGKLKVEQVCFSYAPAHSQAVAPCEAPELDGRPYVTCNEDVTTDRWDGNAVMVLPTQSDTRLAMFGGVANQRLSKLGGFVDNLGRTLPITESVFINRIGVGLCLYPPPFKVRGDVGVAFIPPPSPREVLAVNGYFLYTDAHGRDPWSLELGGSVEIYDELLGRGFLILRPNGSIDFGANASMTLVGVVNFNGKVNGWLETRLRRFNVDGRIRACVDRLCGRADVVLSSTGAAGCVDAGKVVWYVARKKKGWKPWKPWKVRWERRERKLEAGFGHRWRSRKVDLFGNACHLDRYRAARSSAALAADGSATVRIRPGTPAVALRLKGVAAPKIVARGPGGTVVRSPDDAASAQRKGRWMLAENPSDSSTSLLLIAPRPGLWRIEAPGAGNDLAGVERAAFAGPTQILGRVVARGRRRVLSLAYSAPGGASLQLVEVGRGVKRTIARRVRGRRCPRSAQGPGGQRLLCARVVFRPGLGPAGKRRVVAVVTRGGLPVDTFTVSRFRASKSALPAKPRRLRLVRRGGTVTIAWRGSRGATRYAVSARLGDGRMLAFDVGRRCRAVRIRRVARGTGVRATVTGLRADLESGRPAKAKLRAKRARGGAAGGLPKRSCG